MSIAIRRALPTAWVLKRAWSFLSQPINWTFLGVAAILAFLSLYPSFFLLYGSFTDSPLGVPGHFTLRNYIQAYSDPAAYRLILTSFVFGIGASGLSVILALTLAWIQIRTNAPFRKLFELTAII